MVVDLFCGSFAWSAGWLERGGRSIGVDIEHQPWHGPVPDRAQLVRQDIRTLHGAQFKDAALILASPPCQEFSYMAMPWRRAHHIKRALRGQGDFPDGYTGSRTVAMLTALFDACFRLQREACVATGRYIPMVVENVRGAQPWVGRAKWHYGSYYLWGDVPALMPIPLRHTAMKAGDVGWRRDGKGPPPSTFIDSADQRMVADGYKSSGMNWTNRELRGQDFTRIAGTQRGIASVTHHDNGCQGYTPNGEPLGRHRSARYSSKSKARRAAASAAIARIPTPLARWIADVYFPRKGDRW